MEAKDTVLVGCEILCIPPESGLIACPLSVGKQVGCKQRLQYMAGIREVVEWSEEECPHLTTLYGGYPCSKRECKKCWQAKLKEWGIEM